MPDFSKSNSSRSILQKITFGIRPTRPIFSQNEVTGIFRSTQQLAIRQVILLSKGQPSILLYFGSIGSHDIQRHLQFNEGCIDSGFTDFPRRRDSLPQLGRRVGLNTDQFIQLLSQWFAGSN